jgi:hypothetical protein
MAKKEKTEEKTLKKPKINPVLMFFLILAFAFVASTIVLFTLMLPTLVAYVADKNEPRTLGVTVGAMNLAGASSAWLELIHRGHSINQAIDIALNPDNVFIAYGAALVGWMIYLNLAPFVANLSVRKANNEMKAIEKRQQELRENWGGSVAKAPAAASAPVAKDQG